MYFHMITTEPKVTKSGACNDSDEVPRYGTDSRPKKKKSKSQVCIIC